MSTYHLYSRSYASYLFFQEMSLFCIPNLLPKVIVLHETNFFMRKIQQYFVFYFCQYFCNILLTFAIGMCVQGQERYVLLKSGPRSVGYPFRIGGGITEGVSTRVKVGFPIPTKEAKRGVIKGARGVDSSLSHIHPSSHHLNLVSP